MKRLIMLLILLLPVTSQSDTSTIPFYIYNASTEFKLDPMLLYAICQVESRCHPKAINHNDGTSQQKKAGIISKSHGLFQIKLATAKSLGFTGTANDLQKPNINTWYAAKYLNILYKKYHNTTKVISAYNAGKFTYKNKTYVNKVLTEYIKYNIDRTYYGR